MVWFVYTGTALTRLACLIIVAMSLCLNFFYPRLRLGLLVVLSFLLSFALLSFSIATKTKTRTLVSKTAVNILASPNVAYHGDQKMEC